MDYELGPALPDDFGMDEPAPAPAAEPAPAPAPAPEPVQQAAAPEPAPAAEPTQQASPDYDLGPALPDDFGADDAPAPAPAGPKKAPWGASSDFFSGLMRSGVTGNIEGLSQTSELINKVAGADKNSGLGEFAQALGSVADKTNQWGYDARVPALTDIPGDGVGDTLDRTWSYVKGKAGEALGSTGLGIAGRVIGGALGGIGGAETGAEVGGAAGTLVGPEGTIPGAAVGGAAGGLGGAAIGAFTGGAFVSFLQNAGPTWNDLKNDEGVKAAVASGKLSEDQVAYYGLAAGAVVSALDATGLEEIMKASGVTKDAAKPLIEEIAKKTMLEAVAHGAGAEAFTEALQEVINQGTQAITGGNVEFGKRAMSVIENAVGGMLGGGMFSGAHHLAGGGEHAAPDAQPKPEGDTPGGQTGTGTQQSPPADAETQHTEQAPVKDPADDEAVSPADAKTAEVETVEDVPGDIAATMAPDETPQEPTSEDDDSDLEADPSLSPVEQQQQQQDMAARNQNVDPTIGAAADIINQSAGANQPSVEDIVKQAQAAGAKAQADAQARQQQQAQAAVAQQGLNANAHVAAPVESVPTETAVEPEVAANIPTEETPAALPGATGTEAESVATPAATEAEPVTQTSAQPEIAAEPEGEKKSFWDQFPQQKGQAVDVGPAAEPVRETVAGYQAGEPTIEIEPAAEPAQVGHNQPVEEAPPKAPVRQLLSHVGKALADEVRNRFSRDTLSSHPEFRDTLEDVVHGITKNLTKGVAPAQVAREHGEAAAAEVRKRIEARDKAAEAAEVAAGVTAANTSRAVNQEAKLTGKNTERPRVSRVTGEKPAAALATEKPERQMLRIEKKPAAERTPEEQEWYDLYKKKAGIKGGGKKNAAAREKIQTKMDTIKKGWIDAQAERDSQKEADQNTLAEERVKTAIATKDAEEKAGEKTAEEVAQEGREKIARELAEREAKDKLAKTKAEKARVERKKAGREIATKALDATSLDPTKNANIGAIEAMVARVKSAFKTAGLEFPSQMSRVQYSAEENLAIYANQALENQKKDPMAVHFVAMAKDLLANDSAASMYDLLQQTSSTQGVSYNDALHGPLLNDEEAAEAADRAAEQQMKRAARITEELPAEKKPKYKKVPNLNDKGEVTYSWKDKDGSTKSFTTKKHMSGAEAIDWTQKFHPPGRGILGYIRKMHLSRLREMVGDVPVMFVTDADFEHLFGKVSRGVYMHSNVDGMAQGQKGIVLINEQEADRYGRGKADLAHVIEHELSHAATVYAVDTDYRGTKQIVTKMLNSLKEQLKADGVRDLDMINGLKSPKEFVADAYSDPKFQALLKKYDIPTDLSEKLGLASNKQLKWWDAVVAMVRNAMNLERMGQPGRSYLEGMLTLHPDLMMSEREQMRRARTDWYLGGDSAPTSPGYGERLTRSGQRQTEFLQDIHGIDDNLKAALYKRVWGQAKETGRKAWRIFASTEDLKRRVAGYFNNNPDNIYSDAVDNMMKSGEEAHKLSQTGVLTAHKFLKFRNGNPKEAGVLSRLFFQGSQHGFHPAYALSHPTNSHISKKGINHTQLRAQHAKAHAEFNAMSAKGKEMFHELDDHWRKMYNDKNHAIIQTYVEQAIDSGHLVVPKGIRREEVEDFIFSGDMDKPDATLSPNQKVIKQAMGKTFDDLQKMTELRKVKGVYAPFLRHGNKIFTARKDVALPPGATRGREFNNSQEIIFKNKADFKKYLASTDDVVTHRFTRATDPTTGKNVDANGKPLRLIDDVNYMPYYHARVLNRVVRMDNNEANLEHQRKQYEKQGYKTTAVTETDKEMHADNDMMPQHVRRLVRGIERGKGSEAVKKTAVGGILDAYYRQMAGSTSQQRMLKRGGDAGYSKDLLNTLIKTNQADSNSMAALHWRGKFAEDDAKLDKELERRRVDRDPNVMKFQAAVKEMRNRRDAYRDQSTTFGRSSQIIRTMSYIKNLGGPMFSIMNAVQPLGTTLPVLAGRHGDFRSLKNMMTAYYRMGAGRTVLSGGLETLKQGAHFLKTFAPTLYGRESMPREGHANQHMRLVKHIEDNRSSIPNAEAYLRGMKELDDRGWGADSGQEMEDLTGIGRTRGENLLNGFAQIFQQLPKSIEALNRYGTMMAAIDGEVEMARREARKAGVAPDMAAINDRAVRYATTTVERTQGGYNQKNNPNFITSPVGKLAFQYKPYGLMSGQLFWGSLLNSFKGNSPEVRREARRTVVRMSAMTTLMAGAFGLPVMELARSGWIIAEMMGAVDGDWDDQEAKLQTWLGEIFGKGITEDALHGLSRELDIDLSKRLGMDSMVSFGEPKTMKPADVVMWIIQSFAGAPANMALDAYTAHHTGDWTKYPVPRIAKDMGQAWKGAEVGQKSASGATTYEKPSGWTPQRILQGALGVPSADDARKYEAGGSALKYKQKQAASADRQTTEQKWLNAGTASERAAIWADIRQNFNPGKKGKERITYSDLLEAQKRRASSARTKAADDKKAAREEANQ